MRLLIALLLAAILLWPQPCAAEGEYFRVTVTFYTGGDEEQGTKDSITASGLPLFDGCAASYVGAFPLGTRLHLVGWGDVIVADHGTGPESGERWVDIFIPESKGGKEMALELGVITLMARVR